MSWDVNSSVSLLYFFLPNPSIAISTKNSEFANISKNNFLPKALGESLTYALTKANLNFLMNGVLRDSNLKK